MQKRPQKLSFWMAKVPILYNSLIISTYEIGKRKRVTIWLLLKFPGLPWFAVVSNNSCYWCKDKQNVLYDQRKTYFFLSGRLFYCHFDGLIVLLKSFSSSAGTSYALSSQTSLSGITHSCLWHDRRKEEGSCLSKEFRQICFLPLFCVPTILSKVWIFSKTIFQCFFFRYFPFHGSGCKRRIVCRRRSRSYSGGDKSLTRLPPTPPTCLPKP